MKTVIIIPARYASSRLPAKPLKEINGKPLILHVVERLAGAPVSEIIVATDNDEIRSVVEDSRLGRVVMTSPDHTCGTDRIAEVAAGLDVDYILNVQGDQLIPGPEMITDILARGVGKTKIATLYTDIRVVDELNDINTVKVLPDQKSRIIYMSRSQIPFDRGQYQGEKKFFKQVGIYLFARESLLQFSRLTPTPLESIEGVELLRILDYGMSLEGIYTDAQLTDVDVQEDIRFAEKFIKRFPLTA